jgi:erythromycin esterase-like protein
MAEASELAALRLAAVPLTGAPSDFDTLIQRIGEKRFVLLGEASHGTHEFYRTRAAITKILVAEKGFHAVAIEGDWPDSYRVHRFVTGASDDPDATDALGGFRRFPTWMWRNADVLDFVGWLRAFNDASPPQGRRGFFGMDLYSLYGSMQAVLAYLDRTDPEAARRARQRYACFDHFGEDTQQYALLTGLGVDPTCEREVTSQLVEMQAGTMRASGTSAGGRDEEEVFSAEQNARVVKNAEEYYRKMLSGGISTWNLRDRHMVDTLDALAERLSRRVGRAKIVVWAHNSHLGDARATERSRFGEWNVGQLVRERHGDDAFLVGFSTFDGTVTAARDWDAPAERRSVRPALAGSWEAMFHAVEPAPFMLFTDRSDTGRALRQSRLVRAIGVVYRPETERLSHYFNARIGEQFDAILHFDKTRAVEPLERLPAWESGEAPETYPFAV